MRITETEVKASEILILKFMNVCITVADGYESVDERQISSIFIECRCVNVILRPQINIFLFNTLYNDYILCVYFIAPL